MTHICFLNDIVKELISDDLSRMKFLLHNIIPLSQLEESKNGRQLVAHMKKELDSPEQCLMFLRNLLEIIQRDDLVRKIDRYSSDNKIKPYVMKLDDLRLIMFYASMEMDERDMRKIRFKLPRSFRDTDDSLKVIEFIGKNAGIEYVDDFQKLINSKYPKLLPAYKLAEDRLKCYMEERIYKKRFMSLFPDQSEPYFATEHESLFSFSENDIDVDSKCGPIPNKYYKGKFKEVEVVLKYLTENNEIKNWKKLAYIKHPNLLSILKICKPAESDIQLLIFSFNPKSNLAKVLRGHDVHLKWQSRARILHHISMALEFLHKPVKHFRGPVLHNNVSAENIYLDENFNAVLGDISHAEEIQPTGRNPVEYNILESCADDVKNFGIVIFQVLKWRTQSEVEALTGKYMQKLRSIKGADPTNDTLQDVIPHFVDQSIWMDGRKEMFLTLATECINLEKSSEDCRQIFPNVKYGSGYWVSKEDNRRCIQCHFNDSENSSSGQCSSYEESCPYNRKFCRDCMFYAFRNPLFCPFHRKEIYPTIGNRNSYAILLCGYDDSTCKFGAFKRDVDYVEQTITDPRIMNIRLENVFMLNSSNGEEDFTKEWKDIFETKLPKDRPVEFLFIYYSGHESRDDTLKLSKQDVNNLSIAEMKAQLENFKCKRLMIVLDCCNAARIDIKPSSLENRKWIVQWNASLANRRASCNTKTGSLFTSFFLAGLQSKHRCPTSHCSDDQCKSMCKELEKFRKQSKDCGYITIENLNSYIQEHMPNDKKSQLNLNLCAEGKDLNTPIAYYNENEPTYSFIFISKSGDEVSIQLEGLDIRTNNSLDKVLPLLVKEINKYAIEDAASLNPGNLQLFTENNDRIDTMENLRKAIYRNDSIKINQVNITI